MKTSRIFFLAAAAALLTGSAFGGIIVQDLGTPGLTGEAGGSQAVTWTQTGTYSGVTIDANLADSVGLYTATGTAYLMTQLGPAPPTTIANEVTAPFAISVSGNPPLNTGMTTLFTGLTLGPGTYYLLIDPTTINSWDSLVWDLTSLPVQTLGTGVTQGTDVVLSGSKAVFSPASNYVTASYSRIFTVSGTLVTDLSTPEPSSMGMILSGLAGIGIALRKRRIAPRWSR